MATAGHTHDCRTCGAAGEKEECFRASAVGSFRSPPMCSLKLCTGTRATVRRNDEPAASPLSASDATQAAVTWLVCSSTVDRFGLGLGHKLTGRGPGTAGKRRSAGFGRICRAVRTDVPASFELSWRVKAFDMNQLEGTTPRATRNALRVQASGRSAWS